MFMNPNVNDARMIHLLLQCFGQVSGLKVNADKSMALPIRCAAVNLALVLAPLRIPCKSFPVTYLGMPLSLRNLTKADFDPFLMKFGNKTATWKGVIRLQRIYNF